MNGAAEKWLNIALSGAMEELPRYFKYRFINKTDLVIGAILETQAVSSAFKVCLAMKEYVERVFNANVIFDWIPFEEFVGSDFCTTNGSDTGMLIDFRFVPVDGLFFYDCDEVFPSSIFSFSETVIVTAEPTLNVVPTLDLLKIDTMVSALFAVSCCVITLLLTVSSRAFVSRPSRSFLKDILLNFWDTISIFFYEPYLNLSSLLSARLVCTSWLIGVLVICIELSSFLKSEFSIKTYDTVSSLKDLAYHSGVKPYVMKNAIVFRYINFLKDQNRHLKVLNDEILDNNRFFYLYEDMIQEEFYFKLADTRDRKALVIHRFYLNLILGFDLQNIKENECSADDDKPCSLVDLPRVQIGVDDEKRDTLTLMISKHLYQNKRIRELINLAVLVAFETKCNDMYLSESAYNLEFVTWKPPADSFNAHKLTDMRGLFLMFFYMSLISTLVFLLEIVLGNLRLRYQRCRRARRQNPKNSLFFGYRRPDPRRKPLPKYTLNSQR